MSVGMNIGIDAMGLAFPAHYLLLADLAVARGVEPAKFERGLGGKAMAVAHPCEDTVTLAAAAGLNAIRQGGIDPDDVGYVIVGTETAVDHAKPVASYVQGLLGLSSACRVIEAKHACYGATAGVLAACEWIGSGASRGKKALVIGADIARYGLASPGEPTQGGGAAAMVISAQPRLVAIDYTSTGRYSRDVHDFWRPLESPDALVDGALSLECYLEGLEGAYAACAGDSGALEQELGAILFHTPFPRMADKGHRRLLGYTRPGLREPALIASYQKRVAPSLRVATEVGNTYTASLWIALAAVLGDAVVPERGTLGLYSYGSGFCAEFFTAQVCAEGAVEIPGLDGLAQRTAIDVETYARWRDERLGDGPFVPPVELGQAPFIYTGKQNSRRLYERVGALL